MSQPNVPQPYLDRLLAIAADIQASEELANFREEEDDETYKELIDLFEPQLMDLHAEVANHHPLILEAFETAYCNEDLEGLLLPRLLGYSVLRGYHGGNYKYLTPQDHFKTLLVTIANSANFDNIKNRIGQTIQIGFALSSDIWIANLLDQIENKKVKQWLLAQKVERFYNLKDRKSAYTRYKNQFQNQNYFTTQIPSNPGELKLYYHSLKYFLYQRQKLRLDNSNIKPVIVGLLKNKEIADTTEYFHILFLLINFFTLEDTDKKDVAAIFNRIRKNNPNITDIYFEFLIEMYENKTILGPDSDRRVISYLDESIKDDILAYYQLTNQLHTKGFMHADVVEAVKAYVGNYKGLSNQTECVRQAILRYFKQWIDNAGPLDYPEYFEFFKIYSVYMDIFDNENFNQQIGNSSVNYINRLIKYHTDKRGRDYQDIKKFVSQNFKDVRFLKEKEIVELFKTKRKPRA